jgi:hypothetical protein
MATPSKVALAASKVPQDVGGEVQKKTSHSGCERAGGWSACCRAAASRSLALSAQHSGWVPELVTRPPRPLHHAGIEFPHGRRREEDVAAVLQSGLRGHAEPPTTNAALAGLQGHTLWEGSSRGPRAAGAWQARIYFRAAAADAPLMRCRRARSRVGGASATHLDFFHVAWPRP